MTELKSKQILSDFHLQKRQLAQKRIMSAVDELFQEGNLPAGITERAQAITERGHISQKTLYKKFNRNLWHPRYIQPKSS